MPDNSFRSGMRRVVGGFVRLARLPFDVFFLSVDTARAVLLSLGRALLRLAGRRSTHTCWFGKRTGYYGYYAHGVSCLPARKYGNLSILRFLCPCVGAGTFDDPMPVCQAGKRRAGGSVLRLLALAAVLLSLWTGFAFGMYRSAVLVRGRLRARRALADERDAQRQRARVRLPSALSRPGASDDPRVAEVLAKAAGYYEAGDFDSATIEYRKAIKLSPSDPVVHYGKALCFMHRGELLAAKATMSHAAELGGAPREMFFDLARVLMALGQPEAAVEQGARLKGTEHDTLELRLLLASGYQQVGSFSNGMVEAQHALSINSTNINALLRVASLHVCLKERDLAREKFLVVREIDEGRMDALVGLAMLARQDGDTDGAAEHIREALAREPDNVAARVQSAEIGATTGALAVAIVEYRRLIEDHPMARPLRLRLAGLLLEAGRRDEALEAAVSVLELRADSARAHMAAAQAYSSGGFHSKAIAHCEEALTHEPNPATHLLVASAYAAKREFSAALRRIEEGLRAAPADMALLLMRARMLAVMGKRQQAISSLAQTVEIYPDEPLAHAKLAEARLWEGRKEEAVSCYERALELDPQNVLAGNNLASLLLERDGGGDADRAYKLMAGLREHHLDDARIVDTYGWACAKVGKMDEAVASLSFAARLMPRSATVHYHLGTALLKKGDALQAKLELEAALTLSDRFDWAEEARAMVAEIRGRDEADE